MIALHLVLLVISVTLHVDRVLSRPEAKKHGHIHHHHHSSKLVHHSTSHASATTISLSSTGSSQSSTSSSSCSETVFLTLSPSGGQTGPLSSGSFIKPSGYTASSGVPSRSASSTLSSTASAATDNSDNPTTEFIRGVNLGSWLLIEKDFSSNLFKGLLADAVDEWTFDSLHGASTALESHYENHFNESHVALLKSYGVNALRIPIGFWAYDASGTPYYSQGIGKGADGYLEKAVGWAKAAGMKIWVDLHGAPGSQNGFDNSGHKGAVEWQSEANIAKTINILETMAEKYGAVEYKGTVIGLELVNEPISWGANTFEKNQDFAKKAYTAVRAKAANKDMAVVMHDAFESPNNWTTLGQSLGPKGSFVIDTHMYQTLTTADKALTQTEHIIHACEKGYAITDVNRRVPLVVGEWTATTEVCVNTDGTTTAGTKCSSPGCSCVSDPPSKWNKQTVDQIRRYVEAQLEIFDAYTSGYFLWSWTDPNEEMGSWSIKTGMEMGFLPNPLDDAGARMYPSQCDA